MKKSSSITIVVAFCFLLFVLLTFKSCIIQNPTAKDCITSKVKIIKITEGSSSDIVFQDAGEDYYYINRGLERGLNLDSLKNKVLNKTVTLHLAKILGGITSEHISQLTVENEVIFTEFN